MKKKQVDPIIIMLCLIITSLSSQVWTYAIPFHYKVLVSFLSTSTILTVTLSQYLLFKGGEKS